MKNLLCLIFVLCAFASCTKDNVPDNSPVKLDDKSQSTQTLYSNTYQSVVSFSAANSWSAQVAPANKSADEQSWVTISPAAGGAGKVDMRITVEPNPSGVERKAQIDIVCDGTTISIKVVQKGGNDPNQEREIVMIDADPVFKAYLIKKFDSNSDGRLTAAELELAQQLNCSKNGLKSIKGIEYITGLTSLNCDENLLTEIDLSKNHYLQTLSCGNNPIKSITTSASQEALFGTERQIDAIGIGGENLTINAPCIDIIAITGESIKSLDVKPCLRLKQLLFQLTAISSIDISENEDLEHLSCGQNRLTTLDISKNGKLNMLACDKNNITEIKGLDDARLVVFTCSGNNIKSLKVSGVEHFDCSDNPIEFIDLDNSSISVSEPIVFNSTAAKLKIVFGRMEKALIQGMTSELDVSECGSLNEVILDHISFVEPSEQEPSSPTITIMGGWSDFLKKVSAKYSPKTFIDVSQAPSVQNVDISYHKAKSLKIIGGDELTKVNVVDEDFEAYSLLEALDLSQCASIIELNCLYNGNLKSININGCTALETAYLGGNNLGTLDVSTNTKLWKLKCEGNNLSSLDLSKNGALVFIDCSANKLTELDISSCSFGPQYPHNSLKCNDMPTLNTLYLKTGWSIEHINAIIDSHTQIVYK